MVSYRTNKLLALAWEAEKRNKPVFMLSTESSAAWVTVPSQNSYNLPTRKPSAVHLYNNNMNGVDRAEQISLQCTIPSRGKHGSGGERCSR